MTSARIEGIYFSNEWRPDMSKILTVSECADRLQVTERTIRKMALDGRIPSFRVGGDRGHLRFDWIRVVDALHTKSDESDEGGEELCERG
tara:strand:- start:80 stop:349 length:270 start_codon:yes stop_codon:yes gene_type:complete